MIAHIYHAEPRLPELRFAAPIDWQINEGEQWAVIGPNGSGKTLLSDILCGKYALRSGEVRLQGDAKPSELIRRIAFKDIYSLADCRDSYYQQRWHATENESSPTVRELLGEHAGTERLENLLELFGIADLLPKRLLFLSSGELRKFLIVRTLLLRPRLLILDNPFIGLDAASRELLVDALNRLSRLEGTQVILLLSNPNDSPEMVTHVLPLLDRQLLPPMSREAFLADRFLTIKLFPTESIASEFDIEATYQPVSPYAKPSRHRVTLRMEHVNIRYGERTILKDINWEVRNGEKWALLGPNGSGKSTLLSLVYADNPQSYANTLYLFDRKRGTGESIWDIKRRIGYVSPEMHLYYRENVSCLGVVGSGFFDSIGLYRRCTPEQEGLARQWMRLFGIERLSDRPFRTLSSGEQRLALLARAFVKDPDLLILDEPLHGLDLSNKKRAAAIIDHFCEREGKTLIYVTHYVNELPRCMNRLFELRKQS